MKRNSTQLKVYYHGDKDKPVRKKNPNIADIDKQGFSNGSPHSTMSSLIINTPSGRIDMSNTGIPLWANGRILPPYSGIHQFDTTQVKEIPLAKTGGWLKEFQGVKGSSQVLNTGIITMPADKTSVDKPVIVIPKEKKTGPIHIEDTRKIHPVTGKKINEYKDLKTGDYQRDVIQTLINEGKKVGLTKDQIIENIGISLQESMLGNTGVELGHAKHGDPFKGLMDKVQVFPELDEVEINKNYLFDYAKYDKDLPGIPRQNLLNSYARKQLLNYVYNTSILNKNAKSVEERLQYYNTPYPEKGQVNPSTEQDYYKGKNKSFYGVDVTKKPLSMASNPYGKTVASFLPLIQQNPDIIEMLQEAGYKKTGGSQLPMYQVPPGENKNKLPGKFKKKLADPTYGYGYQWIADWYSNPETQKRLEQSGLSSEDLSYALENMADSRISQTYPQTMKNIKQSLLKDGYKSEKLKKLMDPAGNEILNIIEGVHGFASDPEEGVGVVYVEPGSIRRKDDVLSHELTHASTLDRQIAEQVGGYGSLVFTKLKEFYPDLYKEAKKSKDKESIAKMYEAVGQIDEPGMMREVYPYIQSLRYQMGVKPGETITDEMLNNYTKSYEEKAARYPQRHLSGDSALDRLLKLYSKPKLIKFMNTVAYNPNEQEVPMARFGGLPKHQVPPGQTGKILVRPGVYEDVWEGLTPEETIDQLKANKRYFGDVSQEELDKRYVDFYNQYVGKIHNETDADQAREIGILNGLPHYMKDDLIERVSGRNAMEWLWPSVYKAPNPYVTPMPVDPDIPVQQLYDFETPVPRLDSQFRPVKKSGGSKLPSHLPEAYRTGGWLKEFQGTEGTSQTGPVATVNLPLVDIVGKKIPWYEKVGKYVQERTPGLMVRDLIYNLDHPGPWRKAPLIGPGGEDFNKLLKYDRKFKKAYEENPEVLSPLPWVSDHWKENLKEDVGLLGQKLKVYPERNYLAENLLPHNWFMQMAQELGEAPALAEESGSNIPYVKAAAAPLALGAMSGAMSPKAFWGTQMGYYGVADPLMEVVTEDLAKRKKLEEQREIIRKYREKMSKPVK